ncbi:uncharacterized protein LOC141595079 [Silene latifolia]|uniref:uncharacterized protein LOC141595079 n=1 Tax=Silene latifolia TaxID=37657 RepID=UPI003D780C57
MTKIGSQFDSTNSNTKTIPSSSPLFLHPSESPSLKLTSIIFNGENYDLWADAVKNGLEAKNKLGLVNGTVPKPEGKEDEDCEVVAWRQCNAMIKAWLRSVIDEKLHPSIAFSGTVVEIWKELQERYAAGNAARIHQLKSDLAACRQGNRSVVDYYTNLKSLWDELATYSRVPDCTCGAATAFLKEKEEEKIHQFIMGLNDTLYNNIRFNLLMDDDLTSLNRVYGIVLREERHKAVIRIRDEPATEVAMSARADSNRSTIQPDSKEYEPPRCTHCKKWYHTEATFWEKLGLSGRGCGRGRRGGRGGRGGRGFGSNNQTANATTTADEGVASKPDLTADEIEQLRTLLSGKGDTHEKLQGTRSLNLNNWMLDSGCSHHMTGCRDALSKLWQGAPSTVGLPDGSTIVANEHGKVQLTQKFHLQDDQSTKTEIGRGELRDGVYYMTRVGEVVARVGVNEARKGWCVYDLKSKRQFVSRDVHFYENVFPFALESEHTPADSSTAGTNDSLPFLDDIPGSSLVLGTPPDTGTIAPEATVETETPAANDFPEGVSVTDEVVGSDSVEGEQGPAEEESQLGRGAQQRFEPAWKKDYVCQSTRVIPTKATHSSNTPSSTKGTRYPLINYATSSCFSLPHRNFIGAVDAIREPRSYYEAVKQAEWREAMGKEIDALEKNGTWKIVDLPDGKKPIGCKWVYKTKLKADGTIERHKARLVAQGFTQIEGIDYHETFAPVAKMTSVRLLLAVAVAKKWNISQLDINNAFLHGDLDEKVYMRLPQGFQAKTTGKVCRLLKSLYGLKQVSRNWFAKLTDALRGYGFTQSLADYSLFTMNKSGIFLGLLVYVDDMIIVSNNSKASDNLKQFLDAKFGIKDHGRLKFFLGIEVAHGESGLFLCQRKYALEIIKEAKLEGAKPVQTPIIQNHELALSTSALLKDPVMYRRLVGRLVYLTITRPDLLYAVHTLSQFVQAPRKEHLEAALRVVRYLKGDPGKGIVMSKDSVMQLNGYSDSDYARCPLTRRSLTGYFVALGTTPISWKVRKQPTVAKSTA